MIDTVPRRDHLDDMKFFIRTLVCSGLFLTLRSLPGIAQNEPDPIEALQPAPVQTEMEASATPAAPQLVGMPRRPPEPRTLHEFWLVFVAFSAAWVGISIYILRFGAPLHRISESMRQIEKGTEP